MAIPFNLLARYLPRIRSDRQIVIAGTNGKGSVSAALSRMLTDAGHRVTCFTSPHLIHPRERFRIDDQDISPELYVHSRTRTLQRLQHDGFLPARFSIFEMYFIQALHLYFSGDDGPPPDWSIWEVGLGGRLDPTNQIPHEWCGITAIGLDHQEILGHTIEAIAREKFGIITPKSTVVAQPLDPALKSLQAETIERTECQWIEVKTPDREISTTLSGPRGQINAAHALALFEAIGGSRHAGVESLTRVRWPGRFSPLSIPNAPCPVFVSGDHNPQGITSLTELLIQRFKCNKWKNTWILWACSDDKPADTMLRDLIAPLRDLAPVYWALTEAPYKPRRLNTYAPDLLCDAMVTDSNPKNALSNILARAKSDDLVVATGSLYLVGELLS